MWVDIDDVRADRKNAMILQPMNGLTDEEIEKTREKLKRLLEKLGYKVVNTLNIEAVQEEIMVQRVSRGNPNC